MESFNQEYVIKSNDEEHVRRIAKYNANVTITHINDKKITEELTAQQLPDVYAKMSAKEKKSEIKIKCQSENSVSALGLLPPLNDEFSKKITTIKSKMNTKERQVVSLKAELSRIIIESSRMSDYNPPSVMSASEQQTLLILETLHPVGMLHLPSLNKIIFESCNKIFELNYGDKFSVNEKMMTFDLDDGFLIKNISTSVVNKLNIRFQQWKADGFSGPIFLGFDCLEHAPDKEQKNTSEPSVLAGDGLFSARNKLNEEAELDKLKIELEELRREQLRAIYEEERGCPGCGMMSWPKR